MKSPVVPALIAQFVRTPIQQFLDLMAACAGMLPTKPAVSQSNLVRLEVGTPVKEKHTADYYGW